MKVIEFNAVYGFASTGLIIRDIGEALKANGHEVRYVYQLGTCDPKEGYRVGSPLDWKIHALYTRILGAQGWASRGATRKLLHYLDVEKPDVVHLHNLHANYINLPMLLNYLAEHKIATVVTLHDCWFFTGKCCHFAAIGCERWRTGCGNCPKRQESPASPIFDRSASVAQQKRELFQKIENLTVVGCSKWISGLARESFVFRGCRVEQIYNGVDTAIFAPMERDEIRKELGLSEDFVIAGMANKWLDPKNEQVLRSVVSRLQKNEKLVLIGCNDSQKESLKSYRNVVAVGFIKDRTVLARYYNAADVFVNLTFEDTLPTVNMEAICCGTPVVTYDSCGSPELIQEGETGYVIAQRDHAGFCKAIETVKKNKHLHLLCCEIGKKSFDKNVNYQRYIELFHSVVV